jgi:DNA 3'-phosphatase
MHNTKICFLDLDGTLITTKTGHTFPRNTTDWKLLPTTVNFIKIKKKEGFKLILVTNQGGISRGFFSEKNFIKKLDAIQTEMDLFFDKIFIAPSMNSEYRKPKSASVKSDVEGLGWSIDPNESFMIGDAGDKKNDFSDTDNGFAKSLGIKFLHVRDIK